MSTFVVFDILDLENTSGSPVLRRLYSEGADVNFGKVEIGHRNAYSTASVPILVKALSPSLSGVPTGRKLPDPLLSGFYDSDIYFQNYIINNDWTGSSYSGFLSTYGLNPPSGKEPALVFSCFDNAGFNVTDSGGNNFSAKRVRLDVTRLSQLEVAPVQTTYSGLSNAWISYNVDSGVNNKKVFALSIEILNSISGGNETEVHVKKYEPSTLEGYSGYVFVGANCTDVNLYLENTGLKCETSIQQMEDLVNDGYVCFPSGLTQEQQLSYIQQSLSDITNGISNYGKFVGDSTDNSELQVGDFSLDYTVYKGNLLYNDPYTGDYIFFKSYSFDYTGDYSGQYNVAPPYNEVSKTWRFGIDYTGIDQLVTKINTDLSGTNYNLWVKNACVEQSLSGYFENGPLLKATKSSDNVIALESLRFGDLAKYTFGIYAANRPTIRTSNSTKYVLPGKVTIQASNVSGSWPTTLATYSGLNWHNIAPKISKKMVFLGSSFSGQSGDSSASSDNFESETGIFRQGNLAYNGIISGRTTCDIEFNKTIHFYEIPSGETCAGSGQSKLDLPDGNDVNDITNSGKILEYSYLKTGWKFSNPNEYSYYRVVFDDFKADTLGADVGISKEFIINSINLYGSSSGTDLHTGQTCLLGSSYSGQYMGYTTGLLTGSLVGDANGSGFLVYDKFRVTGVPNGNGFVPFQKKMGRATEPFTGLFSANLTGTGFFIEEVEGNFYNSLTSSVYFNAPVSGYIVGQGILSGGPYNIITDEKFEEIKNSGSILMTGNSTGFFTGVIPDFQYVFQNIPCLATITGQITGYVSSSNSGFYNVSKIVSGAPISGHTALVSGSIEASTVLTYNSPAINDVIYINDTLIIYNTGNDTLAPTYFRNINELTSIINSGKGIFGVSGYNDGTKIYLKAVALGISGNFISTYSEGSAGKPSFSAPITTGGQNIYYPITPTGVFTGQLDLSLPATGFYSGFASGHLTGTIKQLSFIRDFSGIWNIISGNVDFRNSGWLQNGSSYNNDGFSAFYSGHPDTIPLVVNYTNNPMVYSIDLARLTVTGYNMNSGLSMLLSGQY